MKIKKYMIPFFSLLFLIIISVTLFVVLIVKSKKDTDIPASDLNQTTAPTVVATPTVSTAPASIPEIITSLYPAYIVNDNIRIYGYIDKSGAFVIDPVFDMASEFHDGVAHVTIAGTDCVIDENGQVLFTSHNIMEDYHSGLASFYVLESGTDTTLYGYMDTKGKVVIEPKYLFASDFNEEGTAYVSLSANKYALIDKTGKELQTFELSSNFDNPWNVQDGYLIYSKDGLNRNGIVKVSGEEILAPSYSEIVYLGDDLFAVKPELDSSDEIAASKQALFNGAGEQLTDYIFYDLNQFHDGYSSATDNTTTFFINSKGERADTLPSFEGRGTLYLDDDVITGNIDEQLIYSTLDKTIFWEANTTYQLSNTLTAETVKFKPNRNVLVYYPKLNGLTDKQIENQINEQLKSIFIDPRKDLTIDDNTSVDDYFSVSLMNNLLIVNRNGYDYPFGAAHGMPLMDYYFIDIRSGVQYTLKDLFKTDTDYITKINELISDEFSANSADDNSMYFDDVFKGITENQYFKLEADALIIYFYPYDIAAYAAGFPEFTIPFIDIMDYIDTNGAFWNSFQK
ncbi:MAG: WG repeat-containing protein [Mobilitalea sp.]